ncbi:TPA: hypothetical protein ACH3X2_002350 [Trebouxia sp. C0005]
MPSESVCEDKVSFQDYERDGYVVINNFLSESELKVLRQECNVLVKHAFEHLAMQGVAQPGWEVVQKGCIFESLPGKPSRLLAVDHDTYVQQRSLWPCCPSACKLLLGTKVMHLVAALLGCPSTNMHNCPRLFNDQYIVKPPGCVTSGFAWHQDSDWCMEEAKDCSQYLSLWCALDDTSQGENLFDCWGLHAMLTSVVLRLVLNCPFSAFSGRRVHDLNIARIVQQATLVSCACRKWLLASQSMCGR